MLPADSARLLQRAIRRRRLDRLAAAYACFEDSKDVLTFFIYAESKDVREWMIGNGSFPKLSKATQAELRKDFLIVRAYNHGVALPSQDSLSKDRGSWVSDKFPLGKTAQARIRLSIAEKTLRYKRAVEVLNLDGTYRSEEERFGRCELISPAVPQHGTPE